MASNNLRVLVSHPGRQHSHQLALALHEADMLQAYQTGVPARPLTTWPVLRALAQPLEKHALLPLPDDQVRHCLIEPLVRRLVKVLPVPHQIDWSHRAMEWFDRWGATQLDDGGAGVLVAYENAALHSFRRAKALGMTTVLDAASFHHAWQDDAYAYAERDGVHARINRHKDREIALADHVLTVSELARESYVAGGVSPERVTAVPVGCDLSIFRQEPASRPADASHPFTFVFAGHAGERKGMDLLLKASAELCDRGIDHRVCVAGGSDEALPWEVATQVERLGRLPQDGLASLFRQAHTLVLPSRHDSFGMVVVEAMATGLPVIVSDHVGAKQAVQDGESGWIVPAGDASALAARMAWCVRQRGSLLAEVGGNAREAAEEYAWPVYRRRVVQRIREVVNGPQRAPAL